MSDRPALAHPVPTWLIAVLAITFTAASGGRFGIELLAWVAPVPWLLWVRRTQTWPQRLLLLGAAVLATTVQLSTIITPPIPWAFAPMFGVPIGLSFGLALWLWDGIRRTTGERHALYAFVAIAVVSDVLGAMTSPMGAWSTTSAHISSQEVVLQVASVFGVAGIAAITSLVAAFLATFLGAPRDGSGRARLPGGLLPDALVLAVALTAVIGFGSWRLAQPTRGPTVQVAGIVTDLVLTPAGLPDPAVLDDNVDTLFARSARAADHGARLVVWNEGATAVLAGEPTEALVARGRDFARQHRVDLVLAFISVTDPDAMAFHNLAVFIDQDGVEHVRYHKRHPVPGETEPSDNPVPQLARPYGTLSLAICYDADFPEISRAHAAAGAGLVALPSSDWAGIDPVHTMMSRIRAIEGGYSLLRPVRAATSAAFDPMGRVRAQLRIDESNDRTLLATLPTTPVPTIYAWLGNWPVLLPAAYLLLLGGLAVRRLIRRT